jgi:hypothetical protein
MKGVPEIFCKEDVTVIPFLVPRGTGKEHGKPNRLAVVPIKFRTESLSITSQQLYFIPTCWICGKRVEIGYDVIKQAEYFVSL